MKINAIKRRIWAVTMAISAIPPLNWATSASREIITKHVFRLLRRRLFVRAAVVSRSMAIASSLLGVFIVFSLVHDNPSRIIAVGKTVTAALAVAGVLGDALIDGIHNRRRHDLFRRRMERRRAAKRNR